MWINAILLLSKLEANIGNNRSWPVRDRGSTSASGRKAKRRDGGGSEVGSVYSRANGRRDNNRFEYNLFDGEGQHITIMVIARERP